MTDPAIRPLVAYYRVSTQRQGVSGLGLEAQQESVRSFARERGLEILGEFVEVESGKNPARPVLNRALALAQTTRARLAVAKLDRLARDAGFVMGLKAAGTEFVACDMPFANRMMIGILAVVAEYEAEQISARTKAALQAARARGVKLGGFRGANGDDAATITQRGRQRMMDNAARRRAKQAPMVAAALDFCGGNIAEATQTLNSGNVPTPSGRGVWHPRMVANYINRGEIASSAPQEGT